MLLSLTEINCFIGVVHYRETADAFDRNPGGGGEGTQTVGILFVFARRK